MTLCGLQHSKGITIFKIFIWWGEVYCQKYCLKSRLTALLTNCHKTKFQTPYLTIYFPKWKFWIQLSFNISSEIVWCYKLCHMTWGFQLGFLVVFVIFPISVLGQVWYLIVLIPDLCPLPYLEWEYTFKFPFREVNSWIFGQKILFTLTHKLSHKTISAV